MTFAFAPAEEDDLERLIEIHSAAYPDARGPVERRRNFEENPRGDLADLFVVRESSRGDIVGHGFLFSIDVSVMAPVRASGVASIAVAPEARGRGVARALLGFLADESVRRGDALQMLWPFAAPFYASLGFAPTTPVTRLRVPLSGLPRGDARAPAIPPRRAHTADVDVLSRGYERARRTGFISRRPLVFERMLAEKNLQIFHLEEGARGHVAWTIDDCDSWQELSVRELVAADDDALRTLLALVAAQRDQATIVEMTIAHDDPLPSLLADPHAVGDDHVPGHLLPLGRIAAGPMVRVLDVAAFLGARGYGDDGSLAIEVEGTRVTMTVSGGRASIGILPAAAKPDLSCALATFSAIATGTLRASDAARFGRCAGEASVLARADRLFATDRAWQTLDEF